MIFVQPDDALVKNLVAQFVEVGIAQYDAIYVIDNAKYNRLYKEMERIRAELKKMPGDQRRALLPLLSHPNVQVRLKAAHSLLALYPDLARNALESIRRSGIEPQDGEAAMAISGLDEGSYIPK
ncbi:hypothetical protein GGQ85_002520 [Nitrobacter vulgaris]|jgi:hypothetical protein|uniref:DUF2019 domain-containing protein n=1 Tax=Nitrobacter vulgaris TaxID=29421 RepID=A0A1V4I065_NITVU|nr:DUF2019 domain-containing protein [Nitrobacter vulgaris]MDR6304805.1 hypothetical protein [Nitrobacter vulgaris]OPH83524.1 hypothetical protein B2M20_06290 [Nitrobacter vulgaris]